MDLYEFYSGRCFDAYNELGAHVVKENVGKSRRKGVDFVTYAPNAESVTVTGEFNSWGETAMERCYDGSFFKCFVPGAKAYTLYFKEKLGGLTVRSADVQISSEGIVLLVRDVEVERYRSLLSGLTAESIGAGLEARLREENPQMEDFRVKVDADSLWFFEGEEGLNADFSAECIGTEGGKTFKETFVGWMLLE